MDYRRNTCRGGGQRDCAEKLAVRDIQLERRDRSRSGKHQRLQGICTPGDGECGRRRRGRTRSIPGFARRHRPGELLAFLQERSVGKQRGCEGAAVSTMTAVWMAKEIEV